MVQTISKRVVYHCLNHIIWIIYCRYSCIVSNQGTLVIHLLSFFHLASSDFSWYHDHGLIFTVHLSFSGLECVLFSILLGMLRYHRGSYFFICIEPHQPVVHWWFGIPSYDPLEKASGRSRLWALQWRVHLDPRWYFHYKKGEHVYGIKWSGDRFL